MVISSFISSILVLALGIWAYMKLESTMSMVAERQLLIEPSKVSYKMWKDMPVSMYQSFTFFNLTNWNQVKSVGQKPRFVEVGPYVYRTIWTKSDINFLDDEKLINFSERKRWIFQAHLSKGSEEDLIWTINTPLMTALALIQNAPVITRNIVSVILDGLGEGAFIKRNIKSLLFDGYADLIVSVGPLFDRRFANFNGKFAYLYNKNDSVDGVWTVTTGKEDLRQLNKVQRFQSSIVNMSASPGSQPPQGLNEIKPECAAAWSLEQATNGQLFAPFHLEAEQRKLEQHLQLQNKRSPAGSGPAHGASQPTAQTERLQGAGSQPVPIAKRFFTRSGHQDHHHQSQESHTNSFAPARTFESGSGPQASSGNQDQQRARDLGKFIFYPDLCRPIHLVPGRTPVESPNGIKAARYFIDPRMFMNSSQVPGNKCFEMNPKAPLANALAATINSVTGANVAMPALVTGGSSPFSMFSPPGSHHHHHQQQPQHHGHHLAHGHHETLFERSNNPASFINNALSSLASAQHGQEVPASSASNGQPVSRLGRVRQLFSNIVSQRMSVGGPGSLLPNLAGSPAGMLIGGHFGHSMVTGNQRQSAPEEASLRSNSAGEFGAAQQSQTPLRSQHLEGQGSQVAVSLANAHPPTGQTPPPGGSDRWITQFRFKWPRGVFSIGQCQLGAPIYASLPHFLDADEYYLEQVDGLRPNRSLHEFYIDLESSLHAIPVGAKARLQLNVATPELRFRNIPNAMIPVLWQEVTFEMDKPVASMLYWSFTMSGPLYRLFSVLLVAGGSLGLLGTVWRSARRSRVAASGPCESTRGASQAGSQEASTSCWHPSEHHQAGSANRAFEGSCGHLAQAAEQHKAGQESESELEPKGPNSSSSSSCSASSLCSSAGSPKQPSSRASSHCELVSSSLLTSGANCAGCLLACLRHSASNKLIHASDNSLVRQTHLDQCNQLALHEHIRQAQAGRRASEEKLASLREPDADKATISSRGSNLDSCSPIYNACKHHQRTSSFK